ncbi:putative phosphoglycerate mutase family [Pseudonocardia sp. Ae168_Ps1]|uniref:histidine phosphatase family protein n=1 Tax=unclassified Pseudonocardia TaxID=2619320 RepID=UPI00094B15DD|nr:MULTISPECIES: histidine phosphatase family protein [unclassified Pseudonocardia]OLL71136.1 putative phosphoglycerate mutase family [Pseudonocardia sp. Ae168_Ps1]OLL77314.1 putative phosphoglycerate mutase family [Pseudonocardia sp. Ae150A_Ps1]OLL88576.1 putative phosphoglycerate mutase family [Pseudonocardia sp. Ae263_Ps1]OLL91403.1 putative phosphoglycerate mutase family [Pseudonocardia sp. Ae356_Ps1]
MQLDLVRHALPERVEHADGTHADPGLTADGHAQAARLVRALAGERVDALHTSTMRRAVQTAAPLAAERGLEPVTHADLREYDAERSEYVPIGQMAQADPAAWERMRAGHLPEHVDAAAFTERVHRCVEGIVVAHAGVVNAYLAAILGVDRTLPFPLDYTGVSRVVCARDGMRKPWTVNEIAHVSDLL